MPEHCRSAVASLAIVNGKVWQRPDSNAVVVDGERITGVGTGRVAADRVVDAGGAWILPAFNDAHVHFLMASRSLSELDLHGVEDQGEIERRIVEYAGDGQDLLPLWKSLRESGELTLRVRLAFDMTPGMEMRDWERRLDLYEEMRRDQDPWISTGILKAFADGVVESMSAALFEPYVGSDERGSPLWGHDELREAVAMADARGWQVQVHAIGDAAIRQALDAFEGSPPGRRHRVEHIEAPHPSDIARFGRMGVVASMQPQHANPTLTEVWRRHLGPARAASGWPWREILSSGGRLAFGTDWPVVPLDPFASLAIASRRLSSAEAIEAWTSGGAYAEHAELDKGEIREGMLADITVVDLDQQRVRATIVGGALVYEG